MWPIRNQFLWISALVFLKFGQFETSFYGFQHSYFKNAAGWNDGRHCLPISRCILFPFRLSLSKIVQQQLPNVRTSTIWPSDELALSIVDLLKKFAFAFPGSVIRLIRDRDFVKIWMVPIQSDTVGVWRKAENRPPLSTSIRSSPENRSETLRQCDKKDNSISTFDICHEVSEPSWRWSRTCNYQSSSSCYYSCKGHIGGWVGGCDRHIVWYVHYSTSVTRLGNFSKVLVTLKSSQNLWWHFWRQWTA